MTIHLPQRWIARLSVLPESGMDYQKVILRLRDGSQTTVIIHNADQFEWPANRPPITPKDIVDITLTPDSPRQLGDP